MAAMYVSGGRRRRPSRLWRASRFTVYAAATCVAVGFGLVVIYYVAGAMIRGL